MIHQFTRRHGYPKNTTFKLMPKEQLTLNGWFGFLEGICAPIDEGISTVESGILQAA